MLYGEQFLLTHICVNIHTPLQLGDIKSFVPAGS